MTWSTLHPTLLKHRSRESAMASLMAMQFSISMS